MAIATGNAALSNIAVGSSAATALALGSAVVWQREQPPVVKETTVVKYTAASGLPDWEADIIGTLSSLSIPNRESIEKVEIGSDVIEIGPSTFANCTSLTSVTMPDSVMYIDSSAFQACSGLTSVTIPRSVVEINDDVFYNCSSIADVYCYPEPSQLVWTESECDDFKADGSTVCHVKAEYLSEYREKFTGEVNVVFVGDLT